MLLQRCDGSVSLRLTGTILACERVGRNSIAAFHVVCAQCITRLRALLLCARL